MTKINLIITLISLFTWSCNNKENKAELATSTKSEKVVAISSPCELISIEDVKNIFSVTEFSIEMQDKVLTHPTCIYKWKDGKVFSMKKIGNQEVEIKMPSEVLIVMVKEANKNSYNRSIKVYKQPQEISNLGDMAVWDAKMSQLSFLANNYLFHVHVKVSNEEQNNRKKAIEVSNLIIEKN